ncbi:TraG family conjugative transposon ATPase [Pedobacter sp. HMF7647]|uniref:TraG family conjugative transposon ATPase n=1 Tax=Hufsiella arboris TaxID=2695275 RepID=A0A7K1Y784_9SPHI|nr:TraG family conjugative transposon ATPase [Hufsiella arboris]MXV50425.1 TraG family conjugative transposon ATPase [Hufsiella arboris]
MDISKIFPVYKVEQDCMISGQGDLTVGYELELPEIFTLSESEYEAFHQAWVRALKVLPDHSVFHKQDWFTGGAFQGDFESTAAAGTDSGAAFLSHSSERFFHERPFLEHRCYVFLTRKPAGRRLSSSGYSNVLRRSLVPAPALNRVFAGEFLDRAEQFVQIMEDSGFVRMKRLDDEGLAGNAVSAGVLERYCFLIPPGRMPVISDVGLKDGLRVGDKECRLFTLCEPDSLPGLCGSRANYDKYSSDRVKFSVGFASPLGGLLNCDHIYNQYVFLDDPAATLKRLETRKLRLQSLSAYSRENAVSREAVNDYLNEAVAGQRMPVKAHFNVLCWSEDPARLREVKNLVSSACSQLDAVAKVETDGQAQIWFAGLPGNEADFPMNDTFDTFAEQACCFLNLESSYRSSVSAFGIRLGDRLSGKPVLVDLSDEPMRLGYTTNRNKFILGPSGSGKSFFTNHMVRSYYQQGSHVLLVDVGHSYRGLCELAGGYYFTYSEADPVRFNPFYLAEGDVLDTEKRESIKTLLLALWKKDDESFRRSEYVALSAALTLYYEFLSGRPDIFPCFNTFYEFLMAEYSQVLADGKVKEKDFDIGNFLYVLNPFYRGGEFDYLLNARENLDLLHKRLIVFELDAIKDHPILFPAVTLIIMEVFIAKMRKLPGVRKMILIEECWKAIAREGMAEYIRYLFKTVRKFFGEAVVVTQEVEDVISSPVVKQAIISNSDCKILLDQRKYQNKFSQIQELLGLTDKEKAQILSMNRANDPGRRYKEVFISLGGQLSKVYRTEVSEEEYLAYTTEESEKLRVAEYAARYGSMARGIAALAAEMRSKT